MIYDMYLIDCARSKYKDDSTIYPTSLPCGQIWLLYVSRDKDDGMPATKPSASIVVVAVSVLV
jgi:hypothetical protein